ncbi:hypothetical protein G6F57_012438 [Rhizopus arrhizus]|uniref:Homeobox domain-containing protein n=3 Tax=Rhizopus TaxID=4842 RepID=I1BLS9_RHIO9|nr:hypothetical protein RO3G_01863 [Rhizopus delemar RA 99-880]KAG0737001.1 hypothetical protein G6F23_010610 [Rhizopus arrhizus]KAG1032861.1 hypothetical protein G6F43_013674 [Rhizopus delemar]KAG0754968.1 hypothetical protein G6F24_012136 [Rhizopus arrhizus]KAG0781263.1 hypothetical protein G6F21_011733 [Rhizopus arrhizus]|eukprot:EIE77159.1 hypothetical protein RO3G_01863 [Rhizopus delemar RA 99-880]
MKPQYSLPSLKDIINPGYERQHQKPSVLYVSSLLSPSDTEYFVNEPVKAKRKRASPSQLNTLNQVFQQTCFPSTDLRAELGKQLGMSPRAVQIWFQNKRQSIRTREKIQQQYRRHYVISPPTSPARISLPSLLLPTTPSSSVHSSPSSMDTVFFREF